jgi:hypothetical protein
VWLPVYTRQFLRQGQTIRRRTSPQSGPKRWRRTLERDAAVTLEPERDCGVTFETCPKGHPSGFLDRIALPATVPPSTGNTVPVT